jgi:hypothetical protein
MHFGQTSGPAHAHELLELISQWFEAQCVKAQTDPTDPPLCFVCASPIPVHLSPPLAFMVATDSRCYAIGGLCSSCVRNEEDLNTRIESTIKSNFVPVAVH